MEKHIGRVRRADDPLTDRSRGRDARFGLANEAPFLQNHTRVIWGRRQVHHYIPWQERARCREYDPEVFFPEKGGSSREAKRICAECPVRIECLNYALRRDERYGVWGGMSERERRRLKRMAS
jgi:WhiB family redox-sensing transcriptional regulator